MTREEQKQITEFIERSVQTGSSVPSVDFEADAIIRALFVRNKEAAYRITMLAIGQEKALEIFQDQLKEAGTYRPNSLLSRFFSNRKSRRHRQEPGIPSQSVSS